MFVSNYDIWAQISLFLVNVLRDIFWRNSALYGQLPCENCKKIENLILAFKKEETREAKTLFEQNQTRIFWVVYLELLI